MITEKNHLQYKIISISFKFTNYKNIRRDIYHYKNVIQIYITCNINL